MADRIQLRRDSAANWTTTNPVLSDGEVGLERDTAKFKVGDGATAWADLPYGGIKGDKGDKGDEGDPGSPGEPGPPGDMTNPMTAVGDLIVGGASGAPQRLPLGVGGRFIKSAAGVLTYAPVTPDDIEGATVAGKSVLTGEDEAALRIAIGLETISQAEAEAGTSGIVRAWTAARVAQAIAALGGGGGGGREILLADRHYYVRADGSDSNDGLSDTAGGAFLGVQKALDTAGTLDFAIYETYIHVADGVYDDGNLLVKGWVGAGALHLVGNHSDASEVVFRSSVDGHLIDTAFTPGRVYVGGFTLEKTGGATGILLNIGYGSQVFVDGPMRWGFSSTGHINLYDNASSWFYPGMSEIYGDAPYHWQVNRLSCIHVTGGTAVTLTGVPHFSTGFAVGQLNAAMSIFSVSFSGSATGRRYYVSSEAVIHTFGSGATFLPGNSAPYNSGGYYI